jgi:hypothetical protein
MKTFNSEYSQCQTIHYIDLILYYEKGLSYRNQTLYYKQIIGFTSAMFQSYHFIAGELFPLPARSLVTLLYFKSLPLNKLSFFRDAIFSKLIQYNPLY